MGDGLVRGLMEAAVQRGPEPSRAVGLPGLLADWQIHARLGLPSSDPARLRIDPFASGTKVPGRPSWGLSSYGYDLRLGRKYKVFSNAQALCIDLRTFTADQLPTVEGDTCVIPPNAYVLAETLEWLEMPEDVLGIVLGKSTYARAGTGLNMTPIEPGWRGKITLEIANHTPLPAVIHSGDGIGQILFFQGSAPCSVPYNRKASPCYQDQQGVMGPRV